MSGLETHIANSYTNPLLQLLKLTPLIRNLALHHAATACLNELCLLCEMGYLFDMLDKAEGQNCQATNFLKTFSSIPEGEYLSYIAFLEIVFWLTVSSAARLGLLEEYATSSPLTDMIQATCRFMLEQTSADFRKISPTSVDFQKVAIPSTSFEIY